MKAMNQWARDEDAASRTKPAGRGVSNAAQRDRDHDAGHPGIGHPGQNLGARQLAQLQRAIGNRAVVGVLARMAHRVAPTRMTSVDAIIQRRGENPYAQVGTHGGWDLTAHHIVAHSTLQNSYKALGPEKKKEILKYSIPEVITDEMLVNLKVEIPKSEDPAVFKSDLRRRLAGEEDDSVEVSSIKLGDMRSSLFEWQGGNQFQGPNTSIRPEPSPSKDDIDYDGQYFTDLSDEDFQSLTTYGAELKELTAKENEQGVFDTLKKILDLTKNVTPKPFDASGWVEVGTLEELEKLVADPRLDRKHLLKYAYYKFALAGIGTDYPSLSSKSGDYFYEGIKIPVGVHGMDGYIPLSSDKEYAKTTNVEMLVPKVLEALDITVTSIDANTFEIPVVKDKVTLGDKGKTFTLAGYPSSTIPYTSHTDGKIRGAAKMLANKKLITTTSGKPLLKYCEEQGMTTSSYLPKKLYDKLYGKEEVPVQESPVLVPVQESPVLVPVQESPVQESPVSDELVPDELVSPKSPVPQASKAPSRGGAGRGPGVRKVGGRRYGSPKRSPAQKRRAKKRLAQEKNSNK